MSDVKAICMFFGVGGSQPITMGELKALSAKDRKELGDMVRRELGVEATPVEVAG